MPITKGTIKVMASENLTDFDDGGGMMSGIEVVSGNVNNLFPDQSRMDRVYGRVSLRKGFVVAMTDDNEAYKGVHVILDDPPDDPMVSVTLFSTKDHFDHRTEARDRIESYVVKGSRYPGYLFVNQLEGARSIQIIQREETALPRIGDVFYIVENEGLVTEKNQYVRVTDMDHELRTFSYMSGSTVINYKRRIVTCETGDALRKTFHGAEASPVDTPGAAELYLSYVADASKYYGVKKVVEAIAAGSFTIKAESIFNNLVPSAQAESPMTDITAGGQVTGTKKSGSAVSFSLGFTPSNGSKIYCGTGIVRGSLGISISGSAWNDDRRGNLVRGGVTEGQVDYGTGIVTFFVSAPTGVYTVSHVPAVNVSGINRTRGVEVILSSRAYNYTATLSPKPEPGTLAVDYMSQGNWYRLQDNGAGELLPLVPGTGSGTLNMDTGSVIITCGALPDVDTTILFAWSAPVEYTEPEFHTLENIFSHRFFLPACCGPGSIAFTYDGTSVTDNGSGELVGVNGKVIYQTGEVIIYPSILKATAAISLSVPTSVQKPVEGSAQKTGSFTIGPGPGNYTTSIGAFKAGTLLITGIMYGGLSLTVRDDGGSLKTVYAVTSYPLENDGWWLREGSTVGTVSASGDLLLNGTVSARSYYSSNDGIKVVTLEGGAGSYTSYSVTTSYETAAGEARILSVQAPLSAAVPGSINRSDSILNIGANTLIIHDGTVYKDYSRLTGLGTIIGSLSASGELVLSSTFTADVPNTIVIKSLASKLSDQLAEDVTFRTPGAPLRPGSFYVQAERYSDGELVNATATLSGEISSAEMKGRLNHETGVVSIKFGKMVSPASAYVAESWYKAENVVEDAVWMPVPVKAATIKCNCVVYTYIPLDASLIGLDPVRLPQDGRVPVFRKGDMVVVHHTQTSALPGNLAAGQQLALPGSGLDMVELYDANDLYVPETKYSVNLSAGIITMANPLDLAGFVQPLFALHRREEMKLLSDVQINGALTMSSRFENSYPANETKVSGALTFGDLQSRVSNIFDQKTWSNVWSDSRIGDAATATYNTLNYPPRTTNRGAIPQNWALVFYSATQFYIMGEQVGVIGEGNTNQDCRPVNPATNEPYFTVKLEGWGSGWVAGNALRFRTMAASAPVWINRTTLQGKVTEPDDEFTIHVRGDGN